MKVIVTGGAGYIGSHAVQRLLDKEYEVIVIDNLCTGWKSLISPFVRHYDVDINDYSNLEAVFKKEKDVIAIFHFAALIAVDESVEKPLEYFETNVIGTINLLKLANKCNIKNFIFSSTAAVYGEGDGSKAIKENDCLMPINPYGDSKLAAERIIKSFTNKSKFNYVIFRYFNVSGMLPGMKALNNKEKEISGTHLIPLINMYALGINKKFVIYGDDYETKDGTCIRDYIHVVDLVDAHILGLEWSMKTNKSNIFNLGVKNSYSVKEVIEKTKKVINKNFKVEIHGRRPGDPAILVANNDKALKILKWKPKYSLSDMIESDYLFRK